MKCRDGLSRRSRDLVRERCVAPQPTLQRAALAQPMRRSPDEIRDGTAGRGIIAPIHASVASCSTPSSWRQSAFAEVK